MDPNSIAARAVGRPIRILISNDDGPPSEDSPFILSFVKALEENPNYDIRVCVPAAQRSWISKAHVITDTLQITYYNPEDDAVTTSDLAYDDLPTTTTKYWALTNGTPAACVNIALYHIYKDITFDIVISGPNVGMNNGTTFSLSSGTIGAALEAASLHLPAIAFSYGYSRYSQSMCPIHREATHARAFRVLHHLIHDQPWPTGSLYNVNIPLSESPHLSMHQTSFAFSPSASLYKHLGQSRYRWDPDWLALMRDQGKDEGTDVAVTRAGHVSITVLRASYQLAEEIVLSLPPPDPLP